MGLDIYAGTLTRYYTHNWKTVTQQFAEANGISYQAIRRSPDTNEKCSVKEINKTVTMWRDGIIKGLNLNPVPLWNEDYDVTPYYTAKPDWDALGALMLYIAAKYSGKEVPATVEKDFNAYEQPIVKEFLETKDFQLTLFDGNGWWLPINRNIMFDYMLPDSEESPLTTSSLLLAELERYNAFGWNADKETIYSWDTTEGYENGPQKDVYNTESLAKFAFSILWQAAEFSLEHGVPILYDF